jgi:orotidine-5'-phosphate decarboxylase
MRGRPVTPLPQILVLLPAIYSLDNFLVRAPQLPNPDLHDRNYPDIFVIAEAKRGDIGNTSKMYASAFFRNFDFDAVTVAPYMGIDSVKPFLEYPDKWVILLALTSNQGAEDFQLQKLETGGYLFEKVLQTSASWGNSDNMMYVVGATKVEWLKKIREIIPDHFLLIPGVGAQGGSLEEVSSAGLNSQCGLLVNASRSIIYADITSNFDDAARIETQKIQQEMAKYLAKAKLI